MSKTVLSTALVHTNEIAHPDDFNLGFRSSVTNIKQLFATIGKQTNKNYFIGGSVEKVSNTSDSLAIKISPIIGYNVASDNVIVSSSQITINIPLSAESVLYEVGIKLAAIETDMAIRKVIDYESGGAISDKQEYTQYTYEVVVDSIAASGGTTKLDNVYIKLCEILASSSEQTITQLPFVRSSEFDETDPCKVWDVAPATTTLRMNTIFELENYIRETVKSLNAAINGKQSTLSWDSVPTENSQNPVRSGGLYTSLFGKLDKSGGALSGSVSLLESKNFLLRPTNNEYTSGIGYDTKGNECIALWAKNTVTRLRWYAGTDMSEMTAGKMMDITPDFEISKATGSPIGYIGGNTILTTNNYASTLNNVYQPKGSYLPTSGGTLTGALNLPINVSYKVANNSILSYVDTNNDWTGVTGSAGTVMGTPGTTTFIRSSGLLLHYRNDTKQQHRIIDSYCIDDYVTSMKDYNDSNKKIKIGYAGDSIDETNTSHFAGYTESGSKIKDISSSGASKLIQQYASGTWNINISGSAATCPDYLKGSTTASSPNTITFTLTSFAKPIICYGSNTSYKKAVITNSTGSSITFNVIGLTTLYNGSRQFTVSSGSSATIMDKSTPESGLFAIIILPN